MNMTFARRSACAWVLIGAWPLLLGQGRARGDATEDRFEVERAALLARRATPEALSSLAALVRMDAMLGPGRLAAVLRDFVEGKNAASADPLVAAQASYFLSLEEDRSGQREQANARRRGLGLLGDLWVLGPFDAQGRSGLERIFPPELVLPDPHGSQCHPSKTRQVCWRRMPTEVARQGGLALGALLRPDNDAVAYVLAYLHSDRGRWAALRLGSPGPVKSWLNGRVVMSRDVVRPASLDQDAAAIWLPRGESVLLVKTVVISGAWQLFLRLTDPQGAPLPGVTANAAAPATGVALFSPPPHQPVDRVGARRLRRRRTIAGGFGNPLRVPMSEISRRSCVGARSRPRAARCLRAGWISARSRSSAQRGRREQGGRSGGGPGGERKAGFPGSPLRGAGISGPGAREEDDARQALEQALRFRRAISSISESTFVSI